mmetsp:Transcript_41690/g.97578  ORF Transcript_41690/g.97578 Transcript_41690/m.97578 type:complete len:264 (-) Transcript_41690:27-818(-)
MLGHARPSDGRVLPPAASQLNSMPPHAHASARVASPQRAPSCERVVTTVLRLGLPLVDDVGDERVGDAFSLTEREVPSDPSVALRLRMLRPLGGSSESSATLSSWPDAGCEPASECAALRQLRDRRCFPTTSRLPPSERAVPSASTSSSAIGGTEGGCLRGASVERGVGVAAAAAAAFALASAAAASNVAALVLASFTAFSASFALFSALVARVRASASAFAAAALFRAAAVASAFAAVASPFATSAAWSASESCVRRPAASS